MASPARRRGRRLAPKALPQRLRGAGAEPEGTLRVVAPRAFGQQVLVGPLAGYLRRYPRMSVDWLLHNRAPDFIADAVDCAIHLGEVNDASGPVPLFVFLGS